MINNNNNQRIDLREVRLRHEKQVRRQEMIHHFVSNVHRFYLCFKHDWKRLQAYDKRARVKHEKRAYDASAPYNWMFKVNDRSRYHKRMR